MCCIHCLQVLLQPHIQLLQTRPAPRVSAPHATTLCSHYISVCIYSASISQSITQDVQTACHHIQQLSPTCCIDHQKRQLAITGHEQVTEGTTVGTPERWQFVHCCFERLLQLLCMCHLSGSVCCRARHSLVCKPPNRQRKTRAESVHLVKSLLCHVAKAREWLVLSCLVQQSAATGQLPGSAAHLWGLLHHLQRLVA
jgi:hypothetical protein